MRVRIAAAIAMLLLPEVSSAQRFPMPGAERRGPAQPVPLSRQPEPIARALAYRRLRVSVESYPLISYVQSAGFTSDGRGAAWTSFGGGTRAEYRVSRFVSATMDLTSSFVGSPVRVQTAEVGARLRPERSERKAYPFVDARIGYVSAFNANLGSSGDSQYGYPVPQGALGARYSRGFGGVAGVGMEYALTRTFSLTTAGSVMRSAMTASDFDGARAVMPNFAMTSYRYTIGIRYNPVRLIMPSASDRL